MKRDEIVKELLELQSRLKGYLMTVLGDLDAVDEVFQRVCVVVLERAEAESIRNFGDWCKEIARRQALQYLRERMRLQTVDLRVIEGLSQAFFEDHAGEERVRMERQALQDCLPTLPARSRELLSLRYEKKWSFDRIANATKSTAGAVQRTISRVRAMLWDCAQRRLRITAEA